MASPLLPKLKPLPIKERLSVLFVERCQLDVLDGAFVAVDVTGIRKGHGYAGVIKRHNASRLKETHGTGPVHRHAGAMAANSDPSRIFKGKIGAGQMGNEQVTVMNLDVISVDAELGIIAVRGAIPGPKGGVVFLRSSVKKYFEPKGAAGISNNPQKASGRNPQKASARNK